MTKTIDDFVNEVTIGGNKFPVTDLKEKAVFYTLRGYGRGIGAHITYRRKGEEGFSEIPPFRGKITLLDAYTGYARPTAKIGVVIQNLMGEQVTTVGEIYPIFPQADGELRLGIKLDDVERID